MKIAVRLPIPVYRAANSRPTPELSPQAANRLNSWSNGMPCAARA